MTRDIFTWAAILILTSGSRVVFAWLLHDVRHIVGSKPRSREQRSDEEVPHSP